MMSMNYEPPAVVTVTAIAQPLIGIISFPQ